jgi:hypothetical protein
MRKACVVLGVTLAILIAVGAAPDVRAEPVAAVVSVDVKGNLDAYLAGIKQLTALAKKLVPNATVRVWQATAAGEATGTVYVVLEHPSLEDYAKNSTKLQADAEWAKVIEKLEATGREIFSSSLMRDVTP